MKFPHAFFCVLLLTITTMPTARSAASYKGEISFSDEEKQAHLVSLNAVLSGAGNCLKAELERHKYFMDRIGISAFYGDQGTFAKKKIAGPYGREITVNTTLDEKRQQLASLGFEASLIKQLLPDVPCNIKAKKCNMLQPTSCIGLTRKCLNEGFQGAGQGDLWKKLDAYVLANGETGDSLLDGLQKLGWKIHYWAPDVSRNAQWDLEEKEKYPGNPRGAWGQHAYSYLTVSKKNRYYLNTVDDYTSMVNFGTGTPELIRRAPFFVGIAHLGYHVFPGAFGMITEGHSARELTDPETVESEPFAPLAEGGGPRGGPYRSGIVALPPSF